ncbi:MAG: ribosome biogenesis factor YjgA [Steroidobacter sp.]
MNDAPERPSKSERKRRSTDLQDLGEALIELPDSELDELPLPEVLRDAVLLARRITAHGGLYRQKQYIGKLMRKFDVEPIRAAIEAQRGRERVEALRFRRIEQWRDRLLKEGLSAVEHLRVEAPEIDVDAVVTLVEQARKEQQADATPRAARELFKILRAALGS